MSVIGRWTKNDSTPSADFHSRGLGPAEGIPRKKTAALASEHAGAVHTLLEENRSKQMLQAYKQLSQLAL
jgi:hypothetical protein